jgi:resuscitation-promoting factor RpfB
MHRRLIFSLVRALTLLIGVAVAALLFAHRPVTLNDDGQTRTIDTLAWQVGWVLKDAGVVLSDQDEVSPPVSDNLSWNAAVITIQRARAVYLYQDGSGLLKSWWTTERLPSRLLAAAGVTLGTSDQLLWNGAAVALDQALPQSADYLLQVRKAQQASLQINAADKVILSQGPTLGRALWDLGLRLTTLDTLSASYNAPLTADQALAIQPAVPFKVSVDGLLIYGRTAEPTVGQALVRAGITLQGLDYAVPAENLPLPVDGQVKVVRVREEIDLQQTTIPFTAEQVADPTTELDQTSLVQVGQAGVKLARVRIRYEDGKEVSRQKETEWVAAQPKNQKIGYGTKVVIHTLDTPDGQIQYWRKVTVYATSFAPCNFIQFIGKCSYTTAAGYPLQKGVIGVGESWYRLMKGWGVYVDGYGSARVGDYGYIPGFWVDLGYSDADFVNWHRNTTLYFLTPVPVNVPWTLPK